MPKLLIAEDDQMLLEIYQKKFTDSGFEVFLAENGKIALSVAKKEKVDIVLTDSIMPEIDGFDLIKGLRSGDYDANIKIIMLSNIGEGDNRKKAIDLGANGFIPKSKFTPTELVGEVKKIIETG
ncbi:MAG: response regulator [Parcubacteria group bacterium]|jgi:DNA-binding response OmpR family regulator